MYRIRIFLLVVCVLLLPVRTGATILYSATYDDNTYGNTTVCPASLHTPTEKCPSNFQSVAGSSYISIITGSPTPRVGARAVKTFLPQTVTGWIYGDFYAPTAAGQPMGDIARTEFEIQGTASVGQTRWYGMSIYVDGTNTVDSNANVNRGPGMLQWHTFKDACDINKSPHLGMERKAGSVSTKDKWDVYTTSDARACTIDSQWVRNRYTLGEFDKNTWHDVVVAAKWVYAAGQGGFLKIWVDGVLKVNFTGPTTYNDVNPQIFKWGTYAADWKGLAPANAGDKYTVLYDEIKIADEVGCSGSVPISDATSCYKVVAPGGTAPVDPIPPVEGAVSYIGSANTTVTAGGTFSYNHTDGPSDALVVAVGHAYSAGAGLATLTYNGVAMTKIADSECLQTGSRYTAFYYLLNPAGGAQNLVWTTNGSGTVWLVPISLHNVNQTTPFGEPGCSSSTVGQISGSVNVTSDAGGLVLDLIAKSSHVETVVPDAGQTLIQFTTTGTTQFRDSYKATSEAGITTMGWSWGNARGFALTALPVKPTLVTSSSPIAEPGPAAFVSGTGTTASVSCDAGTDTNRVLYAAIGQRTSAVSSVTYNGVPLTLVTSQTTLSTLGLYIYRLVAPPTGVNTLTVTLGSSSAEIALMCLPYSGVNQVTPDTFTGAIGTTMPATLTATGTTGGSLLGIVWAALGGSTTFTANQTGLSTQNNLYTNTRTLAAQFADANGTPKPLTWTATGAATSAWRETVVAINPAPAAPSGLRALRRPIMLQ